MLESEEIEPGMTRIWFSTKDQNGNTVPVSAVVLEPTDGTIKGTEESFKTPTIVLAPGTRGAADSCSTALGPKLLGQGNWALSSINVNYERPFYSQFTDRGMRLVITDYIGLGGPGTHTYVNRIEQGHTVLDAARAVRDLGMADRNTPVGLFGYSQGGGAVAAAAELHQEYAPELNLVATFAGAPPADLKAVLTGTSPKRIAPVMAFAINSFAARDAEFAQAVREHFNLLGKFWLWETSRSCLIDANFLWSWLNVNWLTKSGKTIAQLIEEDPRLSTVIEANNLGKAKPYGSMLIGSELDDDLIPHDQVVALYEKYKEMGADVEFLTLYDGEIDTGSAEDTSVDSEFIGSSIDYINSAAG